MKKLTLAFCALVAFSAFTFAGPEPNSGKEMKQVAPPPCPQWYADTEWNVDLWGTYAFTGSEWRNDRYLEADHAWGGGGDFKYFFHRYFGVGLEGWVVDARGAFDDVTEVFFTRNTPTLISRTVRTVHESRAVGSVLGTLTFRYPIPCTRFSPYIFGGGGGIFGGGERTHLVEFMGPQPGDFATFQTHQGDSETKAIGQFGGGIEVRITPHIGWMNDFSWNVVDGSDNNFGMVRSGLNFAF